MKIGKIYVAATSQHIGKTTSTLGLVRALKDAGHKVGYCKPVGQEFVDLGDLRADKDALLFSKFASFELIPDLHSPVILGKGATSAFIEHPEKYPYRERIVHAGEILDEMYDIVVYEGTGHPGVGSVVNLSNADVADLLHTPVIMVVEGGIGNTIDRLNLSLALFRERKVPILGVIINKVRPDKIEKVKRLVGMKLEQMGLKLLGVLPYDKSMMYPIMATVSKAVRGKILLNEEFLNNRVEETLPSSLIEAEKITTFSNLLLMSSLERLDSAISQIERITKEKGIAGSPISGIIITSNSLTYSIDDIRAKVKHMHYIEKYKIPLVLTKYDTLGAVIKINRIEVKINIRTPWKSDRAVQLIKKYVDLDYIVNHINDFE